MRVAELREDEVEAVSMSIAASPTSTQFVFFRCVLLHTNGAAVESTLAAAATRLALLALI